MLTFTRHHPRYALGRRAALGLLATVALVAPLSCSAPSALDQSKAGSVSPVPAGTTAASTATSAPAVLSCAALAASLSRDEQVGQLVMMAISSAGPTASQASFIARRHIGSIVLLGNSTAGSASIHRLSNGVHALGGRPRGVGILLAVDQEGGKVQRLRGPGFDRIPSALSQSKLSSTSLRAKAARWARQLGTAGVDANLAPVADVVPASMEHTNLPIGSLQRGYGPDPTVVAAKVTAFVDGMHTGGVTTAVKHFPGLGRVRGNTDYSTHVVDRVTTRHDVALKGFTAATAAKVDMVMVSSATYTKIDPAHRAVFSKLVIDDLIRKDLKFNGVVVSDSLSAAAVSDYTPGRRAITFLASGGDLLLVGDSHQAPAMVSDLKIRAASDAGFRASLPAKVTRVLRMKAARGLAHCS